MKALHDNILEKYPDLIIRRVRMIDFADEAKKAFQDDSFFQISLKKLKNSSILFIDDIGVENASPYVIESFFQLIDYRYTQSIPTILSSNQSLEELTEKYNAQITSRLMEKCKSIQFTGKDRRQSIRPSF